MIKLASKSPLNMDGYKKPVLDTALVKPNPSNSNKKSTLSAASGKPVKTVKPTLHLPAQVKKNKD